MGSTLGLKTVQTLCVQCKLTGGRGAKGFMSPEFVRFLAAVPVIGNKPCSLPLGEKQLTPTHISGAIIGAPGLSQSLAKTYS